MQQILIIMGIFAAYGKIISSKNASIYDIAAYDWILEDNCCIYAAYLKYLIDFAALRLIAMHVDCYAC